SPTSCQFRPITLQNFEPKSLLKIDHWIDISYLPDTHIGTHYFDLDYLVSKGSFNVSHKGLTLVVTHNSPPLTILEPTKLPKGNHELPSGKCHYFYHSNPERDQLTIHIEENIPNSGISV